jgi:penicillin-binding protein 1A
VWVGNDEDQPMERIVGGSLPARIWKDLMDRALFGTEIAYLPTLDSLGDNGGPPVAGNPENPPPAADEEPKCHFLFFRVHC